MHQCQKKSKFGPKKGATDYERAMRCGGNNREELFPPILPCHLLAINRTNNGFGWRAYIETKEIVGVYVGARNREGAKRLWRSLPALYRQCAVSYTDFWSAYEQIFPQSRHIAVSKTSGKTNAIERFNCTVRQRVARLEKPCLTLAKLENHIGAIWYFIHHYNELLRLMVYLSLLV